MRLLSVAVVAVVAYLVLSGAKKRKAAATVSATPQRVIPDQNGKAVPRSEQPYYAPHATDLVLPAGESNTQSIPQDDGTWQDSGSSVGIDY